MRVQPEIIVENFEGGSDIEEIHSNYPHVSVDTIRRIIEFHRSHQLTRQKARPLQMGAGLGAETTADGLGTRKLPERRSTLLLCPRVSPTDIFFKEFICGERDRKRVAGRAIGRAV
jgi:Protein of unknown function (DUF433)